MALMLWESFCMSQCLMHVSKHTSLEHMAQWQLYKGRNYRKCVTPWLRVNMWSVHCLQALIPLGPFLDGWRLTTCTSWLGSRCYWGSVAVSFVQSFFYLTLKIENLENGFWKCLHFFKKQEFTSCQGVYWTLGEYVNNLKFRCKLKKNLMQGCTKLCTK